MVHHFSIYGLVKLVKEVDFFRFQGFSKQRICIFKYLEVEYI